MPIPQWMRGWRLSRGDRPRARRTVRGAPVLRSRLQVEHLESRFLLSTITWANPTGGDWSDPNNWDAHRLPNATDDVVINNTGNFSVIHSHGSDAVHSLTANRPFTLSGGTLSVAGNLQAGSPLLLSGGTLSHATVLAGTTLTGTSQGGTLDQVTLYGNLNLTGVPEPSAATTLITGNLVLNGTILVGDPAALNPGVLRFDGTQTLSGSGTVQFGRDPVNTVWTTGGLLTIGPLVTIDGQHGFIGWNPNSSRTPDTGAAFVNQGKIQADALGGTITLLAPGWSNVGTLRAQGGATLELTASNGKTWSSSGVLAAVGATTTILLGNTQATYGQGSSFTLDSASSFNTSGGTVILGDTLNNATQTLTLDGSTTGSWQLHAGGAINGGTVKTINGARLIATSSVGSLNGVTLNGDLDLTAAGAGVTVAGGLTLNGTVTLGNGSNFANLTFLGTQALGGTGTVVFAGASRANQLTTTNQSTLTIGAGIRVRGTTGTLGYVAGATDFLYPSFDIQGTIAADTAGGTITVNASDWTCSGNLQALNGGTLNLQGTWTNAGRITAAANSTLNLGDPGHAFTLASATFLDTAGGTVNVKGILNNTGKTLTLNASTTGSWHLIATDPFPLTSGQILGGTVVAIGGASLIGTASGGSLAGVVLSADLDLGRVAGAQVTVLGGLTFNGTISLGNAAGTTHGVLTLTGGPQTLAGAGTIVFGPNAQNDLDTRGSPLTIGAGLTVRGYSGAIDGTFTNLGTLAADRAGGTITLRPDASGRGWSNQGTVLAQNGGTVAALYLPTNFTNGTLTGGTWQVFAGSALRLAGAHITTDAANILLDGANANIYADAGTALDTFAAITTGATFAIKDGMNLTAAGPFNNAGSLTVGANSTFQATLSNLSRGNLSGGTYLVQGTLRLNNTDDIQTNNAAITLQGPNALIADPSGGSALAALQTNASSGQLTFLDGRNFTTSGAFRNDGTLTVGAGSTFFASTLRNYDPILHVLNDGKFVIAGTLRFTGADIVNNAADLTLDGPNSQVVDQSSQDALADLRQNSLLGTFTIQNGRNLTTSGYFLNDGKLVVGQGSTFFARHLSNYIDLLGELLGGTFWIAGTLQFTGANIRSNDADAVLLGPNAAVVNENGVNALANFNLNDVVGKFATGSGSTFTPRPDFRNLGAVTIGAHSTVTLHAGDQFGGGGTLVVSPEATLLMAGTTGTGTIVNNLLNLGEIIVQPGTTLNVGGGFSNYAGGVLFGGTYDLAGTLQFKDANVQTNQANLILDGLGSGIVDQAGNNGLANLTENAAVLTLENGQSLTIGGTFGNDGSLTIGANSSLTVSGTYNHTGILTVQDQGAFNLGGTGTFSGGTLTGTGPVRINGRLTWAGGAMTGPGSTTVAAGAQLTISGTGQKSLDGRSLVNAGNVTWTGSGNLTAANGVSIQNQAGAVFDAQGDATLRFTGGTPAAFTNAGTFRKSAGTGTTTVAAGWTFQNTGTVEVLTGTVNLTSAFQNFDSVTRTLTGGTYRLQGRLQFAGADIVTNAAAVVLNGANAAIVNDSGTTALTDLHMNAAGASITVAGGRTLSLGGTSNQPTNAGALVLAAGGVLSLGADLTSTGSVTWTGGHLAGADTLAIAGGTLIVSGSDDKYLDPGAALQVAANATWTGPGALWLAQGSTWTVMPGGTLDSRDDGTIHATGSTGGRLLNQGTFLKSAGTGTTLVDAGIQFTNNGVVDVFAGTLDLESGATNLNTTTQTLTGGTLDVVGTLKLAGASLQTNAATIILDGPNAALLNSSGANALASLSLNDVAGTLNLRNGRTFQTAAAFTNAGTMAVELNAGLILGGPFTDGGTFIWTGGRISGTGLFDVTTGGSLSLAGSDDKYLTAGGGLRIEGTATWAGTGALWLADGGLVAVQPGGTFDAQADGTLAVSGTGAANVTNLGTFRKSAGVGTTLVGATVAFSNPGTIEVFTGTLELDGSFAQFNATSRTLTGGTYTLTGLLKLPNTAVQTNAASVVLDGVGSGIVDQASQDALLGLSLNDHGGSLTLRNQRAFRTAGPFTNAGTMVVELNAALGLTGTLTDSGSFTWSSGHISGPGTLDVAAGGTLALGGSDDKTLDLGSSLQVEGTTTWAGTGALVLGDGSHLAVLAMGTFDAQNDAHIHAGGTSATVTNQGTFRKSAGTGATVIDAGVQFSNTGTVGVATGTLDIEGTFTNFNVTSHTLTGGSFILMSTLTFPGARIDTNAATVVLNGPGAGIVDQAGHDALVYLTTNAAGATLRISGRSLGLLHAAVDAGTMSLGTGGSLDLGDDFLVTGSFSWTGGSLTGVGAFRVDINGTLDISGPDDKHVANSGGLLIDGDASWSGTGRLWVPKESEVTIMVGGTFEARGDGEVTSGITGPMGGYIVNQGLFLKTDGGLTRIDGNVGFLNEGTVEVDAGTLDLEGDFSNYDKAAQSLSGGTFVLQGVLEFPNAVLRTNYSNIVLTGPDSGITDDAGDDALVFLTTNAAGASLSISGRNLGLLHAAVDAGTMALDAGAVLDLGDDFRVTGEFSWTGGDFTGIGAFQVDGQLDISGPDDKGAENTGGLLVNGEATWTGTGRLWVPKDSGVIISVGGVWDARGDGDVTSTATGPMGGYIINQGLFLKSGGGMTRVEIGVGFVNEGTVEIDSGTLDLEGNFSNYDTAAQSLSGGTFILQGTLEFPNAAIRSNQATLVLNGPSAAITDDAGNDALAYLAANAAGASLTIQNGAGVTTTGPFDNEGMLVIGQDSTFRTPAGYTQGGGLTVLSNGSLAAPIVAINAGVLSGFGTIVADVRNAGTIDVGGSGSTGVLTILGNFTQTAAGVLNLELGGTDPGSGYDQLNISSSASLDGTLSVALLDGFFVHEGDSFALLTFGSRSGDFARTKLPHLGGHLALDPLYADGSLTLVASHDPTGRRDRHQTAD